MKIKKIMGAILSVLIFVAMSVPAFAANYPFNGGIYNDTTATIGVLQIGDLDEYALNIIRDFFYNSKNSDYVYTFYSTTNGPSGQSVLSRIPKSKIEVCKKGPYFSTNFFSGSSGTDYIVENITFASSNGAPFLTSSSSSSPHSSYVSIVSFGAARSGAYTYISYQSLIDNGLAASSSSIPNFWTPVAPGTSGKYTINFSEDLSNPTPDPEPTPPPFVPEAPDITPPFENPSLPVIPKIENEYVPYDTSIWNGFLSNILGKIKTIVIYGFLIMLFLMSIRIVLNLIKTYAKPR